MCSVVRWPIDGIPLTLPELWLKLLDAKVANLIQPVGLESFADVLELFTKAEQEYLCKLLHS